jgi:hypothetical protein
MFKVLAITGSPRNRGNIYRLTNLVETRIECFSDVDFDYLFLSEGQSRYVPGVLGMANSSSKKECI